MVEDKEKSLFKRLYEASKEVLDTMKAPLIERELKRKLAKAVDSAKDQKIDAEVSLQKLQDNIRDYDLNKYLEFIAEIEAADKTVEALTKHYKELFDEELT